MTHAAAPVPPITDRMTRAGAELRAARANGDTTAEFAWQEILDELIDRYTKGER